MINSIFGGQIDIHGGGFDLKFPHHENEIAQEEAHDHRNIANIWMHNGFINLDNQKMSKSLGNVVLAKDLIEKFGGNLIRLLILFFQKKHPNYYCLTLPSYNLFLITYLIVVLQYHLWFYHLICYLSLLLLP